MFRRLRTTCGLARRGAVAFLRCEAAPTAIEYAIMVGFIGVVIVSAVMALGNKVVSLFEPLSDGFSP